MFVINTFKKLFLHLKQSRSSATVSTMAHAIVTIKQGKLKGSVKELLDGTPYYSFKGVPYAQPPIGDLRFKAPLPAKSWEGIREAVDHGSLCPQYDMTTRAIIKGDEDCLFLNVYTKSLQPNSKTPVMVYIHGGGYMSGSGDCSIYGPEFLLQHDVILVTINYRLEVLGFLCLETPDAPGNAGMKDQVAALRWVKENIVKFGGDPGNVTIFGESVGAASVTYHMVSPMSKGLFHKAIAQSGVLLQDWAVGYEPKARAFRLGKSLGKDTKDAKELFNFLQGVPAEKLAGANFKTRTPDEVYRGLPIHFAPVIEKEFPGVEAFLTAKPFDLLLEGKVNKVPLLVGYTSAEGLLMLADHLKKKDTFNQKPSYHVPREIVLQVSEERVKEFGDRIKKFYVGNGEYEYSTARSIADLQTDLHFAYQTHRFLHFYLKLAPSFMYRFDYDTEMNVMKSIVGFADHKGAAHADDLFYLFYNELNKDFHKDQERLQKVVYQLTKFWADFAKSGNPTPNEDGIKWLPYSPSGREYMVLNEQVSLGTHAEKDRVEFWNNLYRDAGLPYITKSTI